MKFRVLKRKEFGLLGELHKSFPLDSKVIVAEDENGIIGTWSLIPYWHVECFEVMEPHRRKAGVAKGLFRTMFSLLRSRGIKTVWTASLNEEVDNYLKRLNAIELPGKHFVLPIGER